MPPLHPVASRSISFSISVKQNCYLIIIFKMLAMDLNLFSIGRLSKHGNNYRRRTERTCFQAWLCRNSRRRGQRAGSRWGEEAGAAARASSLSYGTCGQEMLTGADVPRKRRLYRLWKAIRAATEEVNNI